MPNAKSGATSDLVQEAPIRLDESSGPGDPREFRSRSVGFVGFGLLLIASHARLQVRRYR